MQSLQKSIQIYLWMSESWICIYNCFAFKDFRETNLNPHEHVIMISVHMAYGNSIKWYLHAKCLKG